MNYEQIKLPMTVTRIVDGDTLLCVIDHLLNIYSRNVRIRLDGIDAPEKRTAAGKVSAKALSDKLAGQELMISFRKIKNKQGEQETKKDRRQRYLGTVWIGDRNVNHEMVAEGYAVVYK